MATGVIKNKDFLTGSNSSLFLVCLLSEGLHICFILYQTYLRRDLSTGWTGPIAVHPHPILSQELLQVHVLELEQTPITWQGPLPQQRAQEGGLGVGPQRIGPKGSSDPSGPSSIDTQWVLIRVQGLVFVWREGKSVRFFHFDPEWGCILVVKNTFWERIIQFVPPPCPCCVKGQKER